LRQFLENLADSIWWI